MAKSNRITLDEKLRRILGTTNVYYRAPESVKLHYPAIIYKLSGIESMNADNRKYIYETEYEVTYIGKDPDFNSINIMLNEFDKIRFVRRFTKDNLVHDVFYLYWKN